jgi:OmpA family/PEGA domain
MRRVQDAGMMRGLATALLMLVAMGAAPGLLRAADTGKLRVWAWPAQSDVFVDGQHMGDATWQGYMTVKGIAPGSHEVGVYCYGFVPQRYTVNIEAGKTMGLRVRLQPVETPQTGPWGRIRIVGGSPRAGVLLNGKTPDYSVGHVDEFNQEFGTGHEELLVHPGTYAVSLVHGSQTIWSGDVKVDADQMTTVDVKTGQQTTEKWFGPAGTRPQFTAGMASARAVVAPVTAAFSAEPGTVECGSSSNLKWSSTGAVEGEVSEVGKVSESGSQSVSPKQTTTYTYKAMGPGGSATQSATVNVDNTINASLEVTPQEVHYRKVGQQVVEQPQATLSWTTSKAQTVTIDPMGSVEASGSKQVTPSVKTTALGPVDETETYTLKAVNACGAEETRTASLHIVGTIAPAVSATASEVGLALASIFFPTAYPETARPETGLVKSQAEALGKLADAFKKYVSYDANAKLVVEAHADVRGGKKYNQGLSERRAARVKDYLVSQGVPASAVEAKAYGEDEEMSKADVQGLEEKNPTPPPKARAKATMADWLAYNRRVDISLEPAGLKSSQYYPHGAADSGILWQQAKPRWRMVEKAQ